MKADTKGRYQNAEDSSSDLKKINIKKNKKAKPQQNKKSLDNVDQKETIKKGKGFLDKFFKKSIPALFKKVWKLIIRFFKELIIALMVPIALSIIYPSIQKNCDTRNNEVIEMRKEFKELKFFLTGGASKDEKIVKQNR